MSLIQKLTGIGNFEPTKAYSFEFVDRKTENTLTEVFMLLPPIEYSVSQGYRVNVTPTINGGWVDDFGNDFKTIDLQWDVYFYWMGEPNNPPKDDGFGKFVQKLANNVAGVAKAALGTVGLYDMLSGLDEFFKLRYMLAEGRDASLLGQNENLIHPKENDFENLQRFKKSGMDKLINQSFQNQLNYKDIKIIYHDYDEQNHYEVIIQDFKFQRSKDDPFSFSLNISLLALKPVYGKPNVAGDIERLTPPREIFTGVLNIVNDFTGVVDNALSAILNVVKVIGAFRNFTVDVKTSLSSFITKQAVKIENIRNQINDWKAYTNPIGGNVNVSMPMAIPYYTASDYSDYENGDEVIEPTQTMVDILDQFHALNSYTTGVMIYSTYEDSSINEQLNQDVFTIKSDKTEKENPVSKNYPLYRVKYGDTLNWIAIKYFGDLNYSKIISLLNNISPRDFENNGMVGKDIKLPIDSQIDLKFFERNQIVSWERGALFNTIYQKEISYFGIDIDLSSGDLVVDGTGDLGLTSGSQCWSDNLTDRLNATEYSLNELHPGFGLPPLVGNIMSDVIITKYISNFQAQAKKDPRTKNAIINDVQIIGDEIRVKAEIRNILGDVQQIEAKTDFTGGL